MRELKHHEKKLLRKVDFLQWKSDNNIREIKILRRYMIQNREDYVKYNKIAGLATKLTSKLKKLPADDEFRIKMTDDFLEKLHQMGLISTKSSLNQTERLGVSAFARRRLPVVMVRLKFAETLKQAITYIEQGHVRVGTNVVTDPAFLVTKTMEDWITWVDTSKIKRTVMKYNDRLDDYDLLN